MTGLLASSDPRPNMDPLLSSDSHWYCLRTQPKHEHIAAARLRLCEDVEVFCPRVKLQRSTRRGLVWFTEALFPNYLFARFEMARWQTQVRYCQGVSGIVRFGQEFPIVPDRALDDLRRFVGHEELSVVSYQLAAADSVEIVEGPFRGQSGVVKQLLPAHDRVKVLLEVLGGTHEVDLQLTAVFKEAALSI